MGTYTGKIRTKNNSIKDIEIQARSEDEAIKTLNRMGRLVKVKKRHGISFGNKLSANDRQLFYTRLGAMLSSKVGTSEALRLVRDNFGGKIQEVSGRLLTLVEAGEDLASSVERVGSPDFPPATIALIKAGVRAGDSGKALKDAAYFEYQLHNVSQAASKGIWTGFGTLLMSALMIIGSTMYVGPQITESPLIKMAKIDVEWINTAAWACGYFVCGLLALCGLMAFFTFGVKQIAPVFVDNVILKVPFYKDMVLAKNNFTSLWSLSLLVKSGVRMEDALRLSADAAPRGALRNDLQRGYSAIKIGRSWSNEMLTLHATDKAALACASDRAQISSTLETLSLAYKDLYAQRLATFVPAINLTAAIFMSIAGAVLFGQTIMPMLMATQVILTQS